MQTTSKSYFQHSCPRHAADLVVTQRFGDSLGISSWQAYCAHLGKETTAHLDPRLAKRVLDTAGRQRSNARFRFDDNGSSLLIEIRMKHPKTKQSVAATLEFGIYLDLTVIGADGAFYFMCKGADRQIGQVCTTLPLSSGTKVPVARLITNAKAGTRARTCDGNPLNLRRQNLYIAPPRTRKKAHTSVSCREPFRDAKADRKMLAGKNYDISGRNNCQ
ncbi:MAG: hypothetical protein AAGG57_11220 [Pseudomonadota bacterium]